MLEECATFVEVWCDVLIVYNRRSALTFVLLVEQKGLRVLIFVVTRNIGTNFGFCTTIKQVHLPETN